MDNNDIWDKEWQATSSMAPPEILNSRFTLDAYACIKNFVSRDKNELILEAGCGTGRLCCLLAKEFVDSTVIGVDISADSINVANKNKEYLKVRNLVFEKADLFNLPYSDNYFDVVFNEGVIEHFPLKEAQNYKTALREMMRVTKRGGTIIVAVPNWYCFPHTFYKWILGKMKKPYRYGYEKSFKHSEIVNLFLENELSEIETAAFFPAHSFLRLQGKGFSRIFTYLGKITDKISNSDNLISNIFTKKFGFEIVVKGIKK